jgi:hypothetical protein
MKKLLSIGLLSASMLIAAAPQAAQARPAKAVRSPHPSVKCDKCREWVRVSRPAAASKGQPGYYWKRAPVCPECRQVAKGNPPGTLPARCETCGGTVTVAPK